jgi:glycerol-3-phosphate acyltransferase PlsX
VSAGNTGALMAVARYLLKTMEGIDRPAIATVLPNRRDGFTTVLDLGANVDCTPEHLLQFAVMGSALVSAVDGKAEPDGGPAQHRRGSHQGQRDHQARRRAAARRRRRRADLSFHGNVEGNDIFKGTTTSWCATASSATWRSRPAKAWPACSADFIRQEFTRNALTKLAALVAMPVLKRFKDRVDHRRYNGAALLGLRGLVFKSHGSADAFAFEHALTRAYDAARNRLLDRVTTHRIAELDARDAGCRRPDQAA